jgi:hypothetical protein
MDIDCAEAIAEAIQAHKKGDSRYDLITPAGKLLKTYGRERMMWVLCKHILAKPTGFTKNNLSWAKAYVEDNTGSGDEPPAFTVKVHTNVLDAFAKQLRVILNQKPSFSEKMKDAKKKSEARNNASG